MSANNQGARGLVRLYARSIASFLSSFRPAAASPGSASFKLFFYSCSCLARFGAQPGSLLDSLAPRSTQASHRPQAPDAGTCSTVHHRPPGRLISWRNHPVISQSQVNCLVCLPELLTILTVMNKEKKKQKEKEKGLYPRITLRVISRLNPIKHLSSLTFLSKQRGV